MLRHSRKMRKSNKKVHYGGRHIVLTLVLLMCLFVIYRFNFRTKSDVVETKHVSFVEYTNSEFDKNSEMKSDEDVVLEVSEDENGNKYINFPDKINGYYVNSYRLLSKSSKSDNTDLNSNSNTNVNTNTNSNSTTANVVTNDTTNSVNTIQSVQNSTNNSTENIVANENIKNFSYLQRGGKVRKFNSEETVNTVVDENLNTTSNETVESANDTSSENIINESENTSNTSNTNTHMSNTQSTNTSSAEEQNTNSQSSTENTKAEENINKTSNQVTSETTNTSVKDEKETPEIKEETVVKHEESVREKTFLPGEKYYVDGDEILEFEVMYKTVVINNKKLYKRDLTYDDGNGTIITATGYIPAEYTLLVSPEDKDEMNELKKDVLVEGDAINLGDTELLAAYDISIVKKEAEENVEIQNADADKKDKDTESKENDSLIIDEYQPEDFNQTIEISISSKEELDGKLNGGTIIPVHVKKTTEEMTNDEGETYESENYIFDQINVKDTTNDSINFYTDSFSTFMVLKVKAITENSITIDDTISDKNYYTGKNYTDNDAGTNQNLYTSSNEVKVTLNYYGYDSANGPMKQVPKLDENNQPMYDENTGDPLYEDEPVSGYISATERQNLVTYKLTRYKDASGNIKINLIDNPFCDRPVNDNDPENFIGYGFDGWISHSSSYSISTNNQTFEQTLTTNVGTNTSVTINVYAKWSVANYIFWHSTNGVDTYTVPNPNNPNNNITVTNNGKNPNRPLRTFNTARTNLESNTNYKTATNASNRELNILVIMNGNFDVYTPGKAITITSLYNGTDYSSGTYMSANNSLVLNYDYQIEYIRIASSQGYTADFDYKGYYLNNYVVNNTYYISGNGHNLRIGRGIRPTNTGNTYTTFTQVFGAPKSASNTSTVNNYKLVIESGRFHSIITGSAYREYYRAGRYNTITPSYKNCAITVIGNDIDRLNSNNNNLNVYVGYSSKTSSGTVRADSSGYIYDTYVKSGSIGMGLFNDDINSTSTDPDYPYSGIYLGGHYQATNDEGHRRLTVEGGNISNIIGGLGITQGNASLYKTQIYMKGGTVANIVGGAGRSTTHGDRMIQVTGGIVTYSVSGASNGFYSGTGNPGDLNGDTLVYVGGNAQIGDTTDTLYGVTAGSVLGAGNGNDIASIADTVGRANSTHVIIDGDAKVNGNVYGGGNYGQVMPSGYSSNVQTYNLITENISSNFSEDDEIIISQNTNGGYYIYPNGNNINRATMNNNTEVVSSSKWKFIPSGSGYYIQSVANSNRYLNMTYNSENYYGWTINSRQLTVSNNPQVFTVQRNGNGVTIRGTTTGGNMYVSPSNYDDNFWDSYHYVDTNSTTVYLLKQTKEAIVIPDDAPGTVVSQVDILGGTVGDGTKGGCVFGGSNRNNICGSTQINVEGGTIHRTVYGGCNDLGTVREYATINVYGGTINGEPDPEVGNAGSEAIFAGGKGEDTTIASKAIINIKDQKANISITGNIYGGSEQGAVNGNSKVIIDEDLTSTDKKITMTSNVFGGGKGDLASGATATNAANTEVNINGLDNTSTVTVYGGANIDGEIGGNVLVKIGENKTTYVNTVYGGGNQSEVTADSDSVNVYVYENATVKNVFGGGNNAGIAGTNESLPRAVYIDGATINENVYGGSNSNGTLNDSNVYIRNGAKVVGVTTDGTTTGGEVFGGGFGPATVVANSNVYVDNSYAISVYGGGNEGNINESTNVQITNCQATDGKYINQVFGAGKGSSDNPNLAVTNGTTNVEVTNSKISEVVFGGGSYGKVEGTTNVTIESNSDVKKVYGGGSQAEVSGSNDEEIATNVTIDDSTVNDVYGGGYSGVVGKSTNVVITDSNITNNVFGGGEGTLATTSRNTNVSIDNSTVAHTVYGGGYSATVEGKTDVALSNHSTAEKVYGGGHEGLVLNGTDVQVNSSTVSNKVYGGGEMGDVRSHTSVILNDATTDIVYGGGESATVVGTTVNLINASVVNYAYGGGEGSTATTTNSTSIVVNGSTVNQDVYGGGNAGAVSGSTVVGLTNATIGASAYAAGNGQTATVGKNSYIYAEGTTTIGESIFGGGNAATTGDNSSDAWSIVDIAGATIGKNVYGGANSSIIKGSAIVNIGNKAIEEFYKNPVIRDKTNNSNITINNPNKKVTITGEGANAVVTSDLTLGKIAITGTVFGGGEQMVAGSSYTFDAISVEAVIDINLDGTGYDSTNPLTLNGSIFGSGNASSANKNGDITIKNWGTYTDVKKFTSIQRTGTVEIANSFISLVGITDSTNFDGRVSYTFNIVDDAVKLKDGTTLYLYCGANKVNAFESVYSDNTSTTGESYNKVRVLNYVFDENNQRVYMVDGDEFKDASGTRIAYIGQNNKYFSDSDKTVEVSPATLNSINELIESGRRIETQSVTSDADNRLYMHTGKNINISANEANPETDPKEVKGMTFFGLFTEGGATGFYSGIYDKDYAFGRSIQRSEREFLSAYVMGHHQGSPEHDILVDGFYTNYENIDHNDYENYQEMDADTENYHSTMYVSVITPTPKEASYYRWYCRPGEQIFHYEGSLRASKFSTFGTANIALVFDDVHPNAKISLQSVEVTKINEFGIYDKNTIPNIADTPEEALTRFGMSMKTSNFGWKLNGETNFFYDPVQREAWYPATDTTKFEIENSNTIPEFNFYLFNSNNITEKRQLGTYTITMRMEYAVDALNVGSAILIFDLILDTENYNDQVGYNAAITPGEQYELFSTSTTNVSNKSKFSAFFELAQENFKATKIKGSEDTVATYYNGLYRVLSTRNYVFPKGTTITMIDKSIAGSPKYYYYNVTAADVTNNKTEFRLTDFYDMGNKDLKYDEAAGQAIYYNATTDYEYENFIFIFNFESAEFTGLNDQLDYEAIVEHEPLGIELRADVMNVPRQIFTVLDGQRENDMYFGIYKAETMIDISGVLSKNRIYLGNQVRLTATTDYNVANVSGAATMIFDTRYFDKKLGIVISIYERGKNGNPDRRLEGSDVLGVSFTLGNNTYYPRADGTTRIKIAEKVSNVSSPIMVNTDGASLASGDYYFILQSFGSPDGIYFGTDVSAVSSEISFTVINDLYGLDVRVPDRESIVEGDDGHILTEEGRLSKTENSLDVTINYSSGLANPYLGVSLYRRIYDDEIYGNQYEKVDLDDLVQENLVPVRISYSNEENELPNLYEYEAFDVDYIDSHVDDNTQTTSFTQTYTYEEGPLKTGTYKLMYTLYDRYDTQIVITDEETGTNYYQNVQEYEKIGEDFAYIIVK